MMVEEQKLVIKEPAIHNPSAGPRFKQTSGRKKKLAVILLLMCAALAGAIVWGLRPRLAREKALAAESAETPGQKPQVTVALVREAASKGEIELPGDLQPLVESPIYARSDGYVRRRLVDNGDRVHRGQLLAEIETPEVDQSLLQARAVLAQSQANLKQLEAAVIRAQANLHLSQVTADRWKNLVAKGVVSRQDGDQKQADLDVRNAELVAAEADLNTAHQTVDATQANVHRLEDLQGFQKLTAPFDGVITFRNQNVDPGMLISAGNAGREVFRVAQIDTLRVFVNVPQTYVESMHPGQSAELRVQELPGQVFRATVERTTNSVDTGSRTMLTILRVSNAQHVLMPGMYAQVQFIVPRTAGLVLIPGDALITSKTGPRVAVLEAGNHIHFRDIEVSRDYGSDLEVSRGLSPGDQVILNPNDDDREGVVVDVKQRK